MWVSRACRSGSGGRSAKGGDGDGMAMPTQSSGMFGVDGNKN
jgi:hypothetical protein